MDNHRGHLIFTAIPAWGHLRPLAAFAAKIVGIQADAPPERRTVLTFFTVGDFTDRVKGEIASILDEELVQSSKGLDEQIRVVSVGGEGLDYMAIVPFLFTEFLGYYELLLAEKSITCKHSGKVYSPVSKPTAAVIDFVASPIVEAINASKVHIPIVASAPVSASTMFRTIAPGELCGLGDVYAKLEADISKGDKTEDEIKAVIEQNFTPNAGDVIQIPGLQPFYDYEQSPQEPTPFTWQPEIIRALYRNISHSVGVVLHTTPQYEPEGVPAVSSLLERSGKKLFAVGPLVPPHTSTRRVHGEGSSFEERDLVIGFLDAALKRHGRHSVLYVSFGSVYWPSNQHFVQVCIEELLELKISFIFSTASMRCNIPDDLRSQIEKSEHGMLSAWAPQHAILAHPATGWFMSHCGHNSTIEAMSAGVPVIAWPIEGDQPYEAAYISLTLNAGFELVQVRDGVRGLRPLYRGINSTSFIQPQGTIQAVRDEFRDTLRRAWGEEGQMKRKNADAVRAHLQAAWGMGRDSRKTLEAFIEQFSGV